MREKYDEDKWFAYILSKCRESVASSLLDVGCGNGTRVTNRLADEGFSVTGIDIDEATITQAISLRGVKNPSYTRSCVSKIDGSFDMILCLGVLEHLDKKELDCI